MKRMNPLRFFAELRRRHVVRIGIAYVVVAFGVFQGTDVLQSALDLPPWTTTLVVVLGIVAFPVALVLAWAYEIGPEGIQRDRGDAPPDDQAAVAVAGGSGALEDGSRPSGSGPSGSRRSDAAPSATTGVAAAASSDGPSRRRSIAVLPLANLSGDPENEYFSDGLAEELLNLLSRLPQLRVTSRTSSFSFRGKDLDVRTIAEKLGVDVVLEGSVRRAGKRVRISAQLVDAHTDDHVWAETYDRELEDVFALQEEIAGCIAGALRLRLSPQDEEAIQRGPTTDNVEAYEYYLRARKYFEQVGGGLKHARDMYLKAIELDPSYALAWAGLSQCAVWLATWIEDTPARREEAERASLRALELAPDRAEAHTARGVALALVSRYAEAERHFEQAVRLDPQLFDAWYFFARTKFEQGDVEGSVELFDRAASVQPDDFQSRMLQGQALFALGRRDEAREIGRLAGEAAERHLSLHPDDTRALTLGAGAWVHAGDPDKAIRWVEQALADHPNDTAVLHNAACVFASLGHVERALDILEHRLRVSPTLNLRWIEHDPDFDPLRDHPRFKALLDERRS